MKIHIVQKGDTLWEISQKYNVDFEELKEMNAQLASPDMIMPGMKIRIPSPAKLKESKKQTNKKEIVITPKEESKTIPKPTEPKKKIQVNESPKLQDDKAITLPELQGMDDFYPTTMFPEDKEKTKVEKVKQKPKEEKIQKPKEEKIQKPKEEYVQPTEQKPQYQSPIDYYYSPCTNMMPMNYCPCCYHQQAMMQFHMPSGCCGQHFHPMYSPNLFQQQNQYQYPTQTIQQQPMNQLYPTNNFASFNRNNEPEFFPRPPAMNNNELDKKNDEDE